MSDEQTSVCREAGDEEGLREDVAKVRDALCLKVD